MGRLGYAFASALTLALNLTLSLNLALALEGVLIGAQDDR